MKPRDLYNQVAYSYNRRHDSPATKLMREREEALVARYARGRVLDVGCGTGHHLTSETIGLDISERMLSLARNRSSLLIQANEALPLLPNSMDTILCFFTVLNMTPSSLVEECYRVLKPGGHLLASVASIHDNRGRPEKTIRIHKHKLKLNLFSKESINTLFSRFSLKHFSTLFPEAVEWGNFHAVPETDGANGSIYFFVYKKK